MKIIRLIMAICLILAISLPALAEDPYQGYNYDYWEEVVPAPNSYTFQHVITGDDLGIGRLVNPSDFYVTGEGLVYISDSGNNRIVILDNQLKLIEVITEFDNEGTVDTFLNPTGIYVLENGTMYICDTDHKRVVAIDKNKKKVALIENPQSPTFAADFDFVPIKVGVDYANRVYVIGRSVFQGILSFDDQGEFYGYVGTIKVTINVADILWRKLSTKAQRAKQQLYIPTEFSGLDLDRDGFVYTTNVDTNSNETIKRLNPSGSDVLKRPVNRMVKGDLFFRLSGRYGGPSRFVDIVVRDKGLYSAIDSQRGRVFTYDHEGNLLYIFGGIGSQQGSFKKPVAIEMLGENILVLDQEAASITSFRATEYGKLINTAVALRYDGDEEQAVHYWQEVLKLDANFELAYIGIGKSLLAGGKNKEAMTYLRLGMDQRYYSVAYKRYRNEVLKANLPLLFTGFMSLIGLYIIARLVRFLNRRKKNA